MLEAEIYKLSNCKYEHVKEARELKKKKKRLIKKERK